MMPRLFWKPFRQLPLMLVAGLLALASGACAPVAGPETTPPEPPATAAPTTLPTEESDASVNPAQTTATTAVIDEGHGSDDAAHPGLPETLQPLLSTLTLPDPAALQQHIEFTPMPCTHQMGLGGPPKCAPNQAEGDLVVVFPSMGPSGNYLSEGEGDSLHLPVASVYAIYRVAAPAPEPFWPEGEYAVVTSTTDEGVPALTLYVTDGKIVRATYHLDKFPPQVVEELAEDVLYRTE